MNIIETIEFDACKIRRLKQASISFRNIIVCIRNIIVCIATLLIIMIVNKWAGMQNKATVFD